MRVLIARLGGLNLFQPWVRDGLWVGNGTKQFLSPLPTTILPNRGAKAVESGIVWVKPTEPTCYSKEKSGDLECIPEVPADLPVPELRNSEVFKQAPPEIQKLYTFKWMEREKRNLMIEETIIKRVQKHKYDESSVEVRLARQTATIRRLQLHMEQHPTDKVCKVITKELIERRKKRLKFLRRCDYPLFEYVLERLNLVYYPAYSENKVPQRSAVMMELATQFAEDIKAARLAKYRVELEARKPEFLGRKAQTMRAIIEDEKKLNISPSFTEEEILEVEKLEKVKVEEQASIPKPVEDIF